MPVELHRSHPDVQQAWAEWSEKEKLHVAVAYNNPFRWRTRREHANYFRRHMNASPNVVLHLGEVAHGQRPHEIVDEFASPLDVAMRSSTELFLKENILNEVIRHFPPDWEYGAWIDADFTFTRPDWALEAIHQLQHYDFVQLFSSYSDLTGPTYGVAQQPMRVTPGFAYNYVQRGYLLPEGFSNGGWRNGKVDLGDYYAGAVPGKPSGVGATGGAWAFRRSAFDTVGGLLEQCILGHGDWFMAFGLVGEEAPDMHIDGYTADYRNSILSWQSNASQIRKNIGYVDGYAVHHFHGSKLRRGYASRDLILVKQGFSPFKHIKKDWQGIYQLNPQYPDFRDSVRQYLISRNEDDPNLYGTEKSLV